MTPDAAICARCKLPDCDKSDRGCGLRRTFNRVRSNITRGMPVSEADRAVYDTYQYEAWIDWRADKTEARP